MSTQSYATFKFYDDKYRRCAIFAEVSSSNTVITVIPCNTKDSFSKKKARNLYGDPRATREVFRIDNSMAQEDFMRFCRANFKQPERVTIEVGKLSSNTIRNLKVRRSRDMRSVQLEFFKK